MKKHLILLGFINAGKSFFGRKIAEERGIDYINLGAMFSKYCFDERGVPSKKLASTDVGKFLDLQKEYIASKIPRLRAQNSSVVNLPGKMIYQEGIMKDLKDFCLAIYLNCDYETLEKRIPFEQKGEKALLVNADSYRELYESRLPIYARFADETVTETNDWKSDLDTIMQIIDRYEILKKN